MRVYFFSPIPYSFLHQRPQKIADQLRRQSIAVTFIEPFGFTEFFAGRKAIHLRDIGMSIFLHLVALSDLLFRRRHRDTSRSTDTEDDPEPFEILTLPLILPSNRIDSAFLDRLNAAVYRVWLSRNVFGRMGCRDKDIALVQQPYFGSILRKGDFSRIYYDCLDDLSVFSGHGSRERLTEFENNLLRMAESVFVTSESLESDIRRRRPGLESIRIPNGVDYVRFQELAATSPAPECLRSTTGPVAGYIGILRSWFDVELVEDLAARNPEITFVLVGPYEDTDEIRRLKSRRNIILPGRKPYEEIPSYIRSFDICMIPFRMGDIAETTNPVKVFEYFALGKPVVSTWLRELVPFHERGLLAMAKTPEEFAASFRRLLGEKDEKREDDRRSVARENSWSAHARRMIGVMQNQDSAA